MNLFLLILPVTGCEADMPGYDASFEVLPKKGLLDLRGDVETMALCSQIIQCEFTSQANSRVPVADNGALICLSNDHWIFETMDGKQGEILTQLEAAAANHFHSFVDVSDMYAHIALSGSESREVLVQCVEIDIHPHVFGPGSTSRCAFVDTTTQLTCIDSNPSFELSVFSSYERYVCDWLSMAIGN